MKKHSRISALAAMAITLALGLAGLAAAGAFRAKPLSRMTLAQIETRIAGSTDPALWSAYGDKLSAAGKFAPAASAYQKAVDLNPELIEARLGAGMALAQAADANAFFAYVSKLTINSPKIAVDLLERAEVQGMQSDPRFAPAAVSAKAQAVD